MALSQLGKTWLDPKKVTDVITPSVTVIRGRYDNKIQLRLTDEDLIIRNMRISDIYIPVSDGDTVHKITPGEAYRPDVIAQNQYKDSKLAWVILSANNMKTFFELRADMVIRIPEISTLYKKGGVLYNE